VKRVYWGLLAVVASAFAVFLADVLLVPGVFFPEAPYAVPILVAAYFAALWLVGVATGLTMALFLASVFLHVSPPTTWPLMLVSLAIIGGLAGVLTRRITREHQLSRERLRLLGEVERRAAVLDATIAAIPDAVIIVGPDQQLLRLNATTQALLGLAEQEMHGSLAGGLVHLDIETPDGRPVAQQDLPVVRALQGETLQGVVLVVRAPTGSVTWVSSAAAPIRAADGTLLGAVLILTDITGQRRLEEQLRDLLRAVSHDLRNPLAAIRGQAELLRRRLQQGAPPDKLTAGADSIVASAQRMNTMIQDLVDAARSESSQLQLRREPLDLRGFVLGLRQRLAASLETARIAVEMPAGLPQVTADPARLERILTNLWSNALKYSTPGTPVTVSARQEGDRVITAVSDRGPGISPSDLARLFERYFRGAAAREQREGLGLGLFTTRQLVEAHGGRIWAESQVGVGSTFSFSLPTA